MQKISKALLVAMALISFSASHARAQSPCALATKEEVSEIAGFTVDVATPQSVAGATSCVYGAKTRESVQVRTYSEESAKGTASLCRGGTPVTGLGDAACVVTHGPAVTLEVTKGDAVLLIVWFGAPPAGATERMKQLAAKALARM